MPPVEQSGRAADGRGHGTEASPDQLERWTRVKALFLEALQYPDSERSAFVALAAAGDADLREELDSLLASEKAAASFCESPAARLIAAAVLPGPETVPRLPPGTRLGAYEITGFIAAGGMGAVYRARHTLLGREVAIKTIGQGLADDAARRRLIREAHHASILTHPNICAIHDVGEADGVPFIVMTYVNGRTLREMVGESVLSIRDALEYGAQIAGALEHAHEHGIIHRDLKSSNIVIDAKGEAIVLDFGLARRLPDDAGVQSREPTLTRPDALAGTLSHMAPEVLRGERADTRSDVWALGVLLYELVTGKLPFTGRTQFETSEAILGDAPKPMNPRVPLALRLVIERCLIKDPAGRYQRAQLVADALDAIKRRRAWAVVGRLLVSARRRTLYVAAAAALLLPLLVVAGGRLRAEFGATFSKRISTLALVPLENATGDPGGDYYAEGITDALISQLGAASDVRVLSRVSTARAARTAKTVTEIGAQLGADVIVQGALHRSPDQITIDVRLVRPSDGRVLWSEIYARTANEVLALEADVVRGLAGAIQLTLRPEARERLATIRAVSPEVYEAYLKGRYEWNQRTPKSLQLAIQHFTRAVELDPTYAPAHAALADCFNQLATVMVGTGSPQEYRPRAAAEAIKALQIDPYSAEAHATLGYVWHYEWRWADAEKEFRRAIELNPSYSLARIWYANMLMSELRMKEALVQVTAARNIDPFSLIVNTNVAWILDGTGRHEDAIAQLRKTLALDSTYVQARSRLAGSLASAGRFTEALDEANRVVTLTDSSVPALALVAMIDTRTGRRAAARALLDDLLARSRRQYVPPTLIALMFNALGDPDNTLTWLEKAFAEHSNAIAYLAVDYQHAPLQRNPRFQALLARAGLK
jgi:TolB-like protein/tetratricopeptide (TPR) repeat protein/predicted Ser/Thr protein kinase